MGRWLYEISVKIETFSHVFARNYYVASLEMLFHSIGYYLIHAYEMYID